MKLNQVCGFYAAVLFLALAGLGTARAQDQAVTPQQTPDWSARVKALTEEKESIEARLKTLEEQKLSQPPADSAAAPGLSDEEISLDLGNEYYNIESRWLRLSNRSGSAVLRVGGYLGTQFNLYPGNLSNSTLGGLSSGGSQEDFSGFLADARIDVAAELGRFAGLSISLQNDGISSGGSQFSVPVTMALSSAFFYLKFDPAFVFSAGKINSILSLQSLQTAPNQLFAAPSMVADLVPGEQIGIQASGMAAGWIDYGLQFVNGTQDNENFYSGAVANKTGQPPQAFTGRIFLEPFNRNEGDPLKGLGVGLAGAIDNETPVSDNGVTTSPDKNVWTDIDTSLGENTFLSYNATAQGAFYHWDPQLFYYNGPFGLQAEMVQSIQTVGYTGLPSIQLVNTAWMAQASWVFGGTERFEGPKVDKPFDLAAGQWGALEVGARIHQFNADPNSFVTGYSFNVSSPASLATGAQTATAFGLGVNWWLNDNAKLQAQWEQTSFSGGNVVFNDENLFVFRGEIML